MRDIHYSQTFEANGCIFLQELTIFHCLLQIVVCMRRLDSLKFVYSGFLFRLCHVVCIGTYIFLSFIILSCVICIQVPIDSLKFSFFLVFISFVLCVIVYRYIYLYCVYTYTFFEVWFVFFLGFYFVCVVSYVPIGTYRLLEV